MSSWRWRRREDRDCANGTFWIRKHDREEYRNPNRTERQPGRDPDRKTRNDREGNQTIRGRERDRPDNQIDARESPKRATHRGHNHHHDAIENPADAPDE